MADRLVAPLALLMFFGFVAFLAIYIDKIDLWIVIVVVAAMAGYDFWDSIRHPDNSTNS